MLVEMPAKALGVLARQKNGFVLMVEGASIDKQAHVGHTERWILDTIEFDHAVRVAKEFAERTPGTLVIVTADHETSGAALIGAATADARIGTYDMAGFPGYKAAKDDYPVTTNIDRRLLVGYGANPDSVKTGRSVSTGDQAHTATDVPLSAFGPGAIAFTGVLDNTDVFFRIGQAVIGGAVDRLDSVMTPKKGRVKPRK
jgi:alkaline phosphatase